jgi:hypothetical protein
MENRLSLRKKNINKMIENLKYNKYEIENNNNNSNFQEICNNDNNYKINYIFYLDFGEFSINNDLLIPDFITEKEKNIRNIENNININ